MSDICAVKGGSVRQAVDVAVLREELETMEMEGEAAVELIESAGAVAEQAPPASRSLHLGQMIDMYV